jgi:hypothetical protein
VVRVCRGTYDGPVVVREAKVALQLRSFPEGAATIRVPQGGLTRPGFTALALVSLHARSALLQGFRLVGPLESTQEGDCFEFTRPTAVNVIYGGVVRRNTFSDIVFDCRQEFTDIGFCPSVEDCDQGRFGVVVATGNPDGFFGEHPELGRPVSPYVIEDNVATGVADGLELNGLVRPSDRAMGNRLTGLGDVGAGLAYRRDPLNYDLFTTGRVAGNVVRGFGVGASLFTSGKPLVTANTFEANGVGIAGEDNARITRNVVRGNGDGIRLCFNQPCGSVLVRDNRVTGSARRGIWVLQGDFPAFPMLIQNNRASGSGELDCLDESVEPTAPRPSYWADNIGTTDTPASLCRPG